MHDYIPWAHLFGLKKNLPTAGRWLKVTIEITKSPNSVRRLRMLNLEDLIYYYLLQTMHISTFKLPA